MTNQVYCKYIHDSPEHVCRCSLCEHYNTKCPFYIDGTIKYATQNHEQCIGGIKNAIREEIYNDIMKNEREEIRDEIKVEIRFEEYEDLKNEVKEELKDELREQVKEELKDEAKIVHLDNGFRIDVNRFLEEQDKLHELQRIFEELTGISYEEYLRQEAEFYADEDEEANERARQRDRERRAEYDRQQYEDYNE